MTRQLFKLVRLVLLGLVIGRLCVVFGDGQAKGDDTTTHEPLVKERYSLPGGGVQELLNFIKVLKEAQPTTSSEEYEHYAFPAMKAAAYKIQQIATMDDQRLPGFIEAKEIWLYFRVSDTGDNPNITDQEPLTSDERIRLLEDIKYHFSRVENPSHYAMVAALRLATNHEYAGRKALAAEIYADLGSTLQASKNPEVAKLGIKMLGAARRLRLPGSPIKLTGTDVDGTPFDWSKYRDKVVIIDFWATWCGPCREELANIRKLYDEFHDQGLEVVSIVLDEDRAKAERYLAVFSPPWTTLYDGSADSNPNAMRYGVMSYPTVFIVDRTGKVRSIDSRGAALSDAIKTIIADTN